MLGFNSSVPYFKIIDFLANQLYINNNNRMSNSPPKSIFPKMIALIIMILINKCEVVLKHLKYKLIVSLKINDVPSNGNGDSLSNKNDAPSNGFKNMVRQERNLFWKCSENDRQFKTFYKEQLFMRTIMFYICYSDIWVKRK